MKDIFRPRTEPARTLYDAFLAEAKHRAGRDFEEWHNAELNAVHDAARKYAEAHGTTAPTFEQVCAADAYASGSADYGSKWAYQVADIMQQTP